MAEVDWAVKPVELLRGAAEPVSDIWVLAVPGLFIKDEMVLTGDQSLNATAALHVLVAGSLHGPLTVPARAVSHGVGLIRVNIRGK